jgi:hypothetical protein
MVTPLAAFFADVGFHRRETEEYVNGPAVRTAFARELLEFRKLNDHRLRFLDGHSRNQRIAFLAADLSFSETQNAEVSGSQLS